MFHFSNPLLHRLGTELFGDQVVQTRLKVFQDAISGFHPQRLLLLGNVSRLNLQLNPCRQVFLNPLPRQDYGEEDLQLPGEFFGTLREQRLYRQGL